MGQDDQGDVARRAPRRAPPGQTLVEVGRRAPHGHARGRGHALQDVPVGREVVGAVQTITLRPGRAVAAGTGSL